MKIYRNMSHSEEYLWWVVVSIILQVWKRPSSGEGYFVFSGSGWLCRSCSTVGSGADVEINSIDDPKAHRYKEIASKSRRFDALRGSSLCSSEISPFFMDRQSHLEARDRSSKTFGKRYCRIVVQTTIGIESHASAVLFAFKG